MSKYYISPSGKILKAAIPNFFMKPYKPKNIQFIQITQKGINNIKTFNNKKPLQKKILNSLNNYKKAIKIVSLKELIISLKTT